MRRKSDRKREETTQAKSERERTEGTHLQHLHLPHEAHPRPVVSVAQRAVCHLERDEASFSLGTCSVGVGGIVARVDTGFAPAVIRAPTAALSLVPSDPDDEG